MRNTRENKLRKNIEGCWMYQIRLETNDLMLLNRVSEVLRKQLADSGMKYHVECRFESEGKSFIRWLLS